MDTLGKQLGAILDRRLKRVVPEAGNEFLLDIFKQMNELTNSGRSFKNLRYDSQYSTSHTKKRKDQGYQTSYVDLRMKQKRIEYHQLSPPSKTYAEIGFRSGGEIFYEHHFGKVLNGRNLAVYREIFPKTWLNVPEVTKQKLFKHIGNIMNGLNA